MARTKKREPFKIEDIQMTPMIDVVFQLLIYFVLTFEIPEAFTNLPVYRPAGTPPKSSVAPPVSIRIVVAHGAYSFNDVPTDLAGVQDALIQLGDIDPDQNVIIQCTMDSVQQELVSVLDICSSVGLKRISVLTLGE